MRVITHEEGLRFFCTWCAPNEGGHRTCAHSNGLVLCGLSIISSSRDTHGPYWGVGCKAVVIIRLMPRLHQKAPSESSRRHKPMADKEMEVAGRFGKRRGAWKSAVFRRCLNSPSRAQKFEENAFGWPNRNFTPLYLFPFSRAPRPRAETALLPAAMSTCHIGVY